MYPKPWYQSKTFWLATAQWATNGAIALSYFTTGNFMGLNNHALILLVALESFLFGVAHLIVRFYTNQPVTPLVKLS